MEIIKMGVIPEEKTVKFECRHCGCIFLEERKKCIIPDTLEAARDRVDAKCECPTCKRMVTHEY